MAVALSCRVRLDQTAFTWKDGQFGFLELKRIKKDAIRPNQILWLQAALYTGVSAGSFVLVEWELQS